MIDTAALSQCEANNPISSHLLFLGSEQSQFHPPFPQWQDFQNSPHSGFLISLYCRIGLSRIERMTFPHYLGVMLSMTAFEDGIGC